MMAGTKKGEPFFNQSLSSMFPFLLFLLPSVFQVVTTASALASPTLFDNKTDQDILLAFKASLHYQQSFLAAWNSSTNLCSWPGIGCSHKHKDRVTVVNLSSQGLSGTISPSIGNLTFLRILDISSNKLQGEIPSTVGHLTRLQHLNLSKNLLHGEITTQLRNCTSLERIELDSNLLTGVIPAWIGGMSNLKSIRLSENNITGVIPQSLGNLSLLQEIYFFKNALVGSIPESLGRLNHFQILVVSGNNLSGTIPATFFNLSSLIEFSVTMNELHGMLPSDLGNRLHNLEVLLLGLNHFAGSLPTSIVNATKMYALEIPTNNFSGTVPTEIGKLCPAILELDNNQLVATTTQDWQFLTFLTNCTRLQIFTINNNKLGGMLPSSVANLSAQLQMLYVGFNEISGKIPFDIGNLEGLNQLQLSNNQFTGVMPYSIGRLRLLQILGFENNLLTGLMPSSLGNLTQLLNLYTHNNMFEGSIIPKSLGSLQEITFATFQNNKFTGPLPIHIFNLSSLSYILDLSGNNFVGSLPSEVCALTKLASLYISRNKLSGPLPDSLSNCQSLTYLLLDSNSFNSSIPASFSKMRGLLFLNLTNNTLSGPIPQELDLMDGLKELYISHNNLSGHIPRSFANMTSLSQLDLSFNHLVGEVPSHGVFSNLTEFSFQGNEGLCGGISELHLPPCLPNIMQHRKQKLHLILKVIIPITGIILCFSLVLIFISQRNKQKSQSTTLAGIHLIDDKYPRVSYADLVQGTNGFNINNLIGKGRYGSVYKCSLLVKNTMTTVAVKVFDLQQTGSSRSFIAECEALNKIRHRNLISVITCCSSSDSNQNDFKALVFEFMPNGSLHEWLHIDVHSSQQRQGLTLMQRLRIAVDVVDALDYLHNNCEPPIVHCDLKPSNILLNEDLVAHLGDFGLAKIIYDTASGQLISSKSTIGIRGTVGYVAPEYGEGGQVSPSGDVYSFAIVILELFTGMAPTHDMFIDGLTLQKHVEHAFPGMLMEIVDPFLICKEESYASNLLGGQNAMEDLNNVMLGTTKLALSCSKQTPTERMCIRAAASEMRRIRDHHVKTMQRERAPMQ